MNEHLALKKVEVIRPAINKIAVKTKGEDRNFVSLTLTINHYNETDNVVKSATETYYDEPRTKFFSALNSMLPWAIATAHLSEDWDDNGFVSGLTIKGDSRDVYGYCATVQHRDPETGAVQCVTTRYKPMEECHPQEIEEIEAVQLNGLDYLSGDRAVVQLNLINQEIHHDNLRIQREKPDNQRLGQL